MTRHAPDPAVLEFARQATESGASQVEIAEVVGVSKGAVARWQKVYGWTPRTPMPAALAAATFDGPPVEEPEPEWSDDMLVNQKNDYRRLVIQARDARKMGNFTSAQRSMRDAVNLANDIQRAERARQAGTDVITIPRAEVDAIHADNRDKIARMIERPLLCAECGRRLLTEEIENGGSGK